MIPTKRLLSAVVLSVSYSSNRSPATGSDISKTALRRHVGNDEWWAKQALVDERAYNSTEGKQRRGHTDSPRVGTLRTSMRDDNMNPAAAWLPISNHRGAFTFSADIFFFPKRLV
jgi:hypothetical protein